MIIKDGVYMDSVDFTSEDLLSETVGDFVDMVIEEHQDQPAFSCILPSGHKTAMTYREMGQASDAVAAYLREVIGMKSGEVVALMAPNIMSYPLIATGALKAGLRLTNINPLYTAEEANHQLKDSGAKVMFVVDVFGDKLAEATADTNVEKIFALSLVDMYPLVTRKILGFAMKNIKKIIPAPTRPFNGRFDQILKQGHRLVQGGITVKSYRQGQKPEDVAIYQYTGGTTGRSKGAELTHSNIVSNISQANKRNTKVLSKEDHTMMLVLPLYHVYAFAAGFLSSLKSGTHLVLVPVPRPLVNIKQVFDQFDITVMPGVNTLYLGLLHEKWFKENPPTKLKYCFSGASPLQPAVSKEWEELTGVAIYEGYGLTESTCITSSMDLSKPPRKGSVGTLLPGTKARIVNSDGENMPVGEVGELWLSGPQIMRGYLNRPDVNAEALADGWLRTGDVAKFDEDGYLYIVDRIKDMVIVSGFNVYPTDIEAVMTKSDIIADAAVVGVPDAETGEKLIAYVIPKKEGLTAAEVIEECRIHLTGYKVPKVIRFIDEMPKSPVGKVLRRELRDKALAEET